MPSTQNSKPKTAFPVPTTQLNKENVIKFLHENKESMRADFGVVRLGVFGSFADNRQDESSDIDLVVEFEKGRKSLHSFLGLKRYLEKRLSKKIDIGIERSLKPLVRERIKDKILYV